MAWPVKKIYLNLVKRASITFTIKPTIIIKAAGVPYFTKAKATTASFDGTTPLALNTC